MSQQAFAQAWARTGRAEGGYVNDPSDSGGPTNWGITQKVARAHGYRGLLRHMTRIRAEAIAKQVYWDVMRLDDVVVISNPVADELFDTGFNTGTRRAVEFLQRSLNALNDNQSYYSDVAVDGDLGGRTLHAFRGYISVRRSDEILLRALNCLQGEFYISLAERRQKDEKFLYGWLAQRVKI